METNCEREAREELELLFRAKARDISEYIQSIPNITYEFIVDRGDVNWDALFAGRPNESEAYLLKLLVGPPSDNLNRDDLIDLLEDIGAGLADPNCLS